MRQVWRFLRVLVVTFVYTFDVARKARQKPPSERAHYRAVRQRAGCRLLCRILGIEVDLDGVAPEDGAVLAVCNHFGVLDPIVLASCLPVAFVGKAEMRRWPFIGWVLRTYGVIFVERERRTQANAFVAAVRARLREGVRVLVFPEGTTSGSEAVLPFKTGAFAAVAGMVDGAVLPLYLHVVDVEGRPAVGAVREQVVWAESPQTFLEHFWHLVGLRSVKMEIRVGEPVETAGRSRKELADLTHARVRALGRPVGRAAVL